MAQQQTTHEVQETPFWKTSNSDDGSKENHKNMAANMEDSKTLNRTSRALPLLIPIIQIGLKVIGIGLQIAGVFQKMNSDKKMQKNFEKVFEGIGRNYDAINRNYYAINNVETKVDRNFVVLVLVSELVNKTLSKIEQTRIEMHQEFNRVLTAVEDSRIEPIISKLNNFVQYFTGEKHRIKNLPRSEHVSKLQEPNNILVYLKDSRTPRGDSLRTPLYDIIEQRYAVPKNAGDKTAFAALHALHYATQTYVSVMFFILEQYTYLANYYYDDNDLDEYNRYFTLITTTFQDFRYSLVGSVNSKGLIDDVIDVVRSAKSTEFIVNEREDLTELLDDRIKSLNQIKQQLLDMTLPMLLDTPDQITGKPYFKNSTINPPIGDWRNGKKVSYAVQYKSNDTYSKVGEWSKPSVIHGNANPFLRIPVDPKRRTRLVFRNFDNEKPQLVAVIEEKYQTEFRDIDRDVYNVASRSDESVALGEIEILLRNGADIHKVFEQGRSAIHAAAEGGNSKIANKLLTLDNITNINARDVNGYTPLFIAAEAAHDDFVKLLIRNGADVNIRTYSNNMTALHIAAYKGYHSTINILMQMSKTIDVNAKDNEGFTPLHNAVFGGIPVLNALMLNDVADANAKSTRGLTPLHLAAINNHRDVAEALLLNKKVDLNSKAEGNLTALHFASAVGNLDIVKFLINKNETVVNARSIEDWAPLHFAVSLQKEDVALELINHNQTEVDLAAEGKITPLHLAATIGQNSVLLRILQRKALIEQNTKEGLTPLHLAAMNGNRETVAILLNHSANIETKTYNGWTPLQLAVSSQNSNLVTIKHFINNGANLNVRNNGGETFLHLAAQSGKLDIVKFFTDKNYNVNGIDTLGNTPLHLAAETGALDVVKYLIKKDANISTKNRHDKTVLHFAVASGNVAVVKYFAEKGCDVNAKDKDDNSPLYLAVENNHFDVIEYLLEDQNVDLRSKNNDGKTVLHKAASLGNLDLVKHLVRKRSDINAKDDSGLAALIFAARNGHLDVIKYFIEEKDINVKVVCNFVARPLAAYHGYIDAVKYLLTKEEGIIVPFNNVVSLASAAQNGHLDVVRFLLGEKLDFELEPNQIGVPVFLYALKKLRKEYPLAADLHSISQHYGRLLLLDRHMKIFYLILLASNNGHLVVVKYLIDEELTDINFKSKGGTTILHLAAAIGYTDTVKYLTEDKKADFCIDDNNDMTPLLYATKGDYLDIVKFLVEQGATLNSSSFEALLFAAENGNVDMAKYFIKKNADVNVKIKGGPVFNLTFPQSAYGETQTTMFYDDTPLSIAVKNNRSDMVKYLIKQGANVNASGENGRTPLHFAVQNDLKMTTYLVEKDADVNAKDKNGQSPLHFAVQNDLTITSYLIEKGGDVNAKDQANCNILHNAAKYGHLNIVQYLVDESKVDINGKDRANHSPDYYAASNGFLDIVKYLVDEKHAFFLPPHHLTGLLDNAVKKHHLALVRYLIQKGARPGDDTLHKAVKDANVDIVKCLVEHGANVRARTTGIFSWGLTPIHEAARHGHLDIVRYFADEKHVDINVKDKYNWTPLHYAADNGHLDVVKYLIDKKHADPNSKGNDGKTPLNCAAAYPSTFQYIAESGMDLHKACQGKNSISCIEGAVNLDQPSFITHYVYPASKINASYSDGFLSPTQTALQHAMVKRQYKVAEYLVFAGVNVNAKNPGGLFFPNDLTALHIAAEDDALSIAELLVKKGADINAKTDTGLTPLSVANLCCNTAVVNFLNSKGARRNRRSTDRLKISNNKYAAEVSSSSNKPFSWINAFAHSVKDTVMCVSQFIYSPFKSFIGMEDSQAKTVPIIATTDTNGALLLLDVFIRKITGQKYISTVDPTATFLESMGYTLRIIDEFETIVKISADNCGISLDSLNIDVVEMQKEITKKVRSGKLHEITDILSVCIDQIRHNKEEKVAKFIVEFEERMSEALDEIIQNMFENSAVEVNSTKEQQIFSGANKMMCNTLVQGHLHLQLKNLVSKLH